MIWTEMKSDPHNAAELVTQRFYSLFKRQDGFFVSHSGEKFSLHVMGDTAPWNFLVIEYQDTGEDGDAFYPSDYDAFDDLIADMVKEIDADR